MDINSLFSTFSLVAVIIYMYIGIYTFRQNKESNIHKTFLLLCSSYAIWSLAYSFAYLAVDDYTFSVWNKISALGWCSFSSITLYLVLLITGIPIIKKRATRIAIFTPAVVFLFMAVLLFGQGINTLPVVSKIFYIGNFLYNFSFLLISIMILFVQGLRTKNKRIKKQSNILVLSSIIPFMLNLLAQTILPAMGIKKIPLMGQLFAVIMIAGAYIVITKYNFLKVPEKFILEEVINEMLDMVILIDEKGKIIRISRHTLSILEYQEDELLNHNIDCIIGSDKEEVSIDKMRESNIRYNDACLLKKNGRNIPVNISCKQIFDNKVHEFLGVILIIQDISLVYEVETKNQELQAYIEQLKAAEEELRFQYDQNINNERKLSISEEKFRTIFEQAPLGITLRDSITGHLYEVNSKFAEITGRVVEELQGKDLISIVHPEDMDKCLDNIAKVRNKKVKSCNMNTRYFKPDGNIIWINLTIVSANVADKINPCEIWMIEDITVRMQSEETLRGIIDNNPMSIQVLDRNGHTKKVNAAHSKLFGALPPSGYSVFTDPQLEKQGLQELIDRAKDGEVVYFPDCHYNVHEVSSEFPDLLVWVRLIIFPISRDGLEPDAYVMMHEDISERKRMEKLIFSENEKFKTTLLSVCDGVISTDQQGNIEIINKVGEQLTGWTQKDALGKPLEDIFNIVNEFSGEKCENPVLKVLETRNNIEVDSNTILMAKGGINRPIEHSAAPIMDKNGNVSGVVLVFRDFTEKKERQREIEYLSYHDQLTGLYNRRFFEAELNRLDVERNYPLAIIMADVNGLKLINDSFGHAMGDELLKKVAESIEKGCRADDITARLGGDEFIILLPRTDVYELEQIIKRINALINIEKVGSIDISVSFGYEIKDNVNIKIQEALKKAEDHMYKKKLFESPSMRGKTIQAIISTLHEKNKREEQHSHRVSELCKCMAKSLGLPQDEIEELRTVGLLHDIGKIAIEENILNKPGKLTDVEWKEIIRHPEIGYRILSTAHDMSEIAGYVLAHHERWDGNGYPKHLRGEEIPLQARIIAIADAYDAMTSERSYRNALSEEFTIGELQKNAGIQFDPELVKVFVTKVLGRQWDSEEQAMLHL